ncbi:hypothetical protein X798_06165 [Onchocerca flexuosa]|uniref:Uncharacterized protein n=1 Tax=Onchocerca flexuosa TaxID=387005 RepID=A0A238BQA5_9BILA|nr:hypothetical protein X798_06165 [Onchocerca flexuosa]
MFLNTVYFYSFLLVTIVLIDTNNCLPVPAGLRPAKKDEALNLPPTPKVPPNLSIRSRMMAALSASVDESNKKKNSSNDETDDSSKSTNNPSKPANNPSKPPIVFSKGSKKTILGKITQAESSKGNVRVIVAPPPVGC